VIRLVIDLVRSAARCVYTVLLVLVILYFISPSVRIALDAIAAFRRDRIAGRFACTTVRRQNCALLDKFVCIMSVLCQHYRSEVVAVVCW